MVTSEIKAFEQAVLENPLDDTVRLVYADWLMERGDPRGEFIKLQVEGGDTSRIHQLLRRYGNKWVPPCLRVREYYWSGATYVERVRDDGSRTVWDIARRLMLTFRRGFVDHIYIPSRVYRERAERIFTQSPVSKVFLSDLNPSTRFTFETNSYMWERDMSADFQEPVYVCGKPNLVPAEVFDLLDAKNGSFYFVRGVYGDARYPTEGKAWADLSQAAVRLGRTRAGLEKSPKVVPRTPTQPLPEILPDPDTDWYRSL